MLQTISPSEMKRIEQRAIAETRVSGATLMERAAAHVARVVEQWRRNREGDVLCICGTGNNGGDGIAAARLLADAGADVAVWLCEGKLSADAEAQWERLLCGHPSVRVERCGNGEERLLAPEKYSVVVDALFGTGLSRALDGIALNLCKQINAAFEAGVPVVAVDIPSGLNGETGEIMGAAVCATETVTFHRPKSGLFLGEGLNQCGRVTVADIGLSRTVDDAKGFWVALETDLPAFFPPRKRTNHKGSYGRVLVVAGSVGMAGAAALCAMAALRTGAGLVTVACPAPIVNVVQALCPCATCLPLPIEDVSAAGERILEALEAADAVAFGCGWGREAFSCEVGGLLADALAQSGKPAVLDADALNLLAMRAKKPLFSQKQIITPHPAEAARLLGMETARVVADAPAAARMLAHRLGASVVLKGAASVMVCAEEEGLNIVGTPAMAKGGSGDALTGILAALLANSVKGSVRYQGRLLLQAGCLLHGRAGCLAAESTGERGLLATELCTALGNAEKRLPDIPCVGEAALPPQPNKGGQATLGRMVHVTVDHPWGVKDPQQQELRYELNFGYVQEVLEEQNEWQDAYVLGVEHPVEVFEGEVVALIERIKTGECVWVVSRQGSRVTEEQVRVATRFREKDTQIVIQCI